MTNWTTSWLRPVPADLVITDTDVWSCVVLNSRDRDPRVARWRRLLLGKQVLISAQTEGELRFGALICGWGAARREALEAQLARTPTLPVSDRVIHAFATVRADCHRAGHQLANKHHMGDAWVAATAIAHGIRLLSGDGIYKSVDGLLLVKDDDD